MPPLLLSEKAGTIRFTWNGLRQDGAFPSSGTATVTVTAELSVAASSGTTSSTQPRQARQATHAFSITPAAMALSVEAVAAELDLTPG